ncbi:MAG TPA: GerMN domain-containing protein [bacterium]|jgi:spore germination protein GerM|nr:GerMN domain-containing protein [bacterium]
MGRRVSVLLLAVFAVAGCRPAPAGADVSVFFTRAEGTAFTVVAARRTVQRGDTAARVREALLALLEGPTDAERGQGLGTAIPAGTRLRGVRVEDGVVWADFSREIDTGGGSASMLGRFWQIVYTATQFPDAPRVRILIEGAARDTLGGEGVIIERPVARPETPPRF